ncbi:MAG: tetratricopeptide repeat protein [Chitinivibrionales bacterium]|nr:tetratricopeptide repeat protein [Chitinivibrionales bacterium]
MVYYSGHFFRRVALIGLALGLSYAVADEKFEGLIAAGKFDKAIEYADQALAASGRTADIWLHLAEAYQQTGASKTKVLSCFHEAQKLDPKSSNLFYLRGNFELHNRQFEDALADFQESFLIKRTALAAEGIAVTANVLKLADKAHDAAESAIALDSTVIQPRLILAKSAFDEKNYAQSAKLLEYIAVKKGTDLSVWKNLAECYKKLADRNNLARVQGKIVELDKKDIESRRALVEYKLSRTDTAAAVAILQQLAALMPGNTAPIKQLFLITDGRGQKKEALLYLKQYLALDSTAAEMYKTLGDLLYDQKDFPGALEAYRHTLRLDPQAHGFYARYALLLLQLGPKNEAVAAIKGAARVGEATAALYTTLGDIYKKNKQFAEAAAAYQDALKTDTKNNALLSLLAECYALSGDRKNAIITYEQVVLINPNAGVEYKVLGDLNMQAGNTGEALAAYKKYLAKKPDDAVARTVGMAAWEAKQYQEAIKYLTLVKQPGLLDVACNMALGLSYYFTGDCTAAAGALTAANAGEAGVNTAKKILKPLAECLEKAGKQSQAAAAYQTYAAIPGIRDSDASFKSAFLREKSERAVAMRIYESNISLFPKDYRSFARLGVLLADNTATLATAAARLAAAALLADTVPMIWFKLGEVNDRLGKGDKALAAYKKFLTLDPKNGKVARLVGLVQLKKGLTSEGITNLETALGAAPDDVEVILALAHAYLAANNAERAIALLSKAKTIKKEDADLRIELYGLYKQTQNGQAAEAEIKQLIDLNKNSTTYKVLYIQDLFAQGRYDEAQKLAATVLSTEAANVDLLLMTARIQKIKKNYDEAMETYKSVLYIKADNPAALCERADIYLLQSKLDRAKEYYDKSLKVDPRYAPAEMGLAQLAKAQNDKAGYQQHLAAARQLDPAIKEIP